MTVSPGELLARLERFPRVALAHLPTPLEPAPRLSATAGATIWLKRDDCTGLGLGGNKVRKLEYLLGRARADGADRVVTFGALQSNHARQTAAACNRLGLSCELLLSPAVPRADPSYLYNGNQVLFRLFGARVQVVVDDAARETALAEVAARSSRLCVIPTGGSSPAGALGYVCAAVELVAQAHDLGVRFDRVVTPVSTAGTYAGLLAGLHLVAPETAVTAVDVYHGVAAAEAEARRVLVGLADLLDEPHLADLALDVRDGYQGDGYGIPTPAMWDALGVFAATEGVVLDPVYSGKAAAGLLDLVGRGEIGGGETVVFWHTGGTPGLFAYEPDVPGG